MFNENEEYEEEYETSQRMNEQHNFQNDNYDNPDIKNNNVSYREQNAEIEEEMNEIQNIPLSSNNQNQNNKSYISSQIQSYRVKPKCSKFLIFILTKYPECILNYLDLIEICYLRSVNSIFLETIHNYFQYRLRFEISIITQFQQMNIDKTEQFMKNIDAQIPLSTNNWLDFNLQSITTKLKILNRSIITKLRAIKSIGKLPDHIYAPFCIIFGYNKPINKLKTWKSTAHKILSEPNLILTIANLDLENLNDSDILNAFVYLNLPELEVKNISKFSNDFGKLILWCQAVVSYHIIIHPYTYRNDKGVIEYGGEVYEFAMEMSRLINRFYKFKRFLNRLNIVKLPLADYVFNLEHTRELPVEEENYLTKLTPEIIGNILSYLPYNESFRYITLAKLFYSGFKCSCDFYILKLLHELYHVKRRLNGKIPLIQIYNIFSSFYLMLNDILYISTGNFFTKEQMKDIKGLKSTSNIVNSIAKAFCLLCGIPPVRKSNAKGEVIILYLDKLKLFAINGSLNKIVKNANLLALDKKDILIIQEELVTFNTSEKLNEIRKINLGLYQVLIWSMLAVEFLKYFNPFEFIDEDFYFNTNESTNHNEEEARNKDAIIYHIDLLNSLKQHINTLGNNVPNYNDPMMQSQRLFHKKISMDLPPQNAMEMSQRPMRPFQRGATAENMDHMMISSQPPSRVNKNMQFPSNKSQIIMNESEQNMLKQWINPNKKLTFDLLFSSLYSPLSISSFHQSCDKIRPTLILILTDNGCRIGGFVTKPWDIDPNTKSKKDEFAFIFSLDLCEKYTILNNNSSSALFYTQNSIVGFGNDLFINDQSKGFKSYCHHPIMYCSDHQGRSITNGKKEFNVKLMEVFAVKFS